MDSSLRGRFARLGRVRGTGRVMSGSPAVFVLRLPRPPGNGFPKTIDGVQALVRRGMNLLQSKQTIEVLLEGQEIVVNLPTVEDPDILTGELAEAGITATLTSAHGAKTPVTAN